MFKTILIVLILSAFFIVQIENAIDDLEIKNNFGEVEFRILDGNKIKLSNRFRNSSSLKLSLNGAGIDKIQEQPNGSSWILTLSDKSSAQLSVLKKDSLVEYYLIWHGGGPNVDREVCFHYGFNGASWYNTYQSNYAEWPMETHKILSKTQFNNLLEYSQMKSPPGEFQFILEHLFMNSDGFAILLDEYQPLFIRRDANHGDPVMCFSVGAEKAYATQISDPTYLDIKVRLFVSTNIRTVTDYVVHKSGHLPKPLELPDEQKFILPSVFSGLGSQKEMLDLIEQLEKRALTNLELIHNGAWAKSLADFQFDQTNFPQADQMLAKIHSKGYRLCLEVYPEAKTIHEQAQKYFVKYQNGSLSNFMDFTNPEAADWYLSVLKRLHYEQQISAFLAFSPNISNAQLHNQKYPNEFYKNYINSVVKTTGSNTTAWIGFRTQNLPIFIQLLRHDTLNETEILPSMIRNALSVSLAGYPFIKPDRIIKLLNEEFLIRWIQASSLMPSFSIENDIALSNSAKLIEMLKKFMLLHAENVPTIVELANKRIQTGSPIIRPLWYVAPDDPRTYKISDQFMLGDDILVAPVLSIGQRDRIVYFPLGIWTDQQGKQFRGPGESKIAAPLEELPYFKRKHL